MDIDFDPRRPKNCPIQRSPLSFCPQTKISSASQIIVLSILDILMPHKSLKAHFLNNLQTAIDHLKIIDEVHQLFFVGNSSSFILNKLHSLGACTINYLNVDIYFKPAIMKPIMEGFARFFMSQKRNC